MEKLRVQYKLAFLAKEIIILDTLLGPKPEKLDLPLDLIYKETIIHSSARLERERSDWKIQLAKAMDCLKLA